MRLVFVYGTLMTGFGNNRLLANAEFRGVAATRGRFRMLRVGFPVLMRPCHSNYPGAGIVRGELWAVDPDTLARLDQLEGEGMMYRRRLIKVATQGQIKKAYAYFGIGDFWRRRGQYYHGASFVAPIEGVLCWRTDRALDALARQSAHRNLAG